MISAEFIQVRLRFHDEKSSVKKSLLVRLHSSG